MGHGGAAGRTQRGTRGRRPRTRARGKVRGAVSLTGTVTARRGRGGWLLYSYPLPPPLTGYCTGPTYDCQDPLLLQMGTEQDRSCCLFLHLILWATSERATRRRMRLKAGMDHGGLEELRDPGAVKRMPK